MLLVVHSAQRTPWRSSLRRSVILVPTGILGALFQGVFGKYALVASLLAWTSGSNAMRFDDVRFDAR